MKHGKMLAPVSSIVLLLTCFVALSDGNWFTDLFNPGFEKTPKFSGSQLYLLTPSQIGLDGIAGYIGCFGDFNSDKYTDIFVITGNDTDTMVSVYLWNMESWQFFNSSATVISPYITNLAAGDFNYDGKLDLLVSGLNPDSNNTYIKLYFGDLTTLASTPATTIETANQVSVMDMNNDLKLDLFGEIPRAENDTGPLQRAFWLNRGDGQFDLQVDSGTAPLRSPHSNAFVDMDGDCLADRFVISTQEDGTPQYELWINAKNKGYVLHTQSAVPLPQGAGQISFADFDRDGNLDFVVPVCYPQPDCSEENSIYVIFNQQKNMCPNLLSKSPSCRSSTDLCSADNGFRLGNINASTTDPYVTVVPTSAFTGHFYFDNEKGRPLTLRVGDYNLDGYPDLLVPMVGKDGTSHIELWGSQNSDNGRRTFARVDDGVDELTSIPNAYAAAFFDLDEDGMLDIFVLADNPPRIESVFNNIFNDAFFLKSLGLNGVCPEWCPTGDKFPSPKPYGVNFVGGVFKYTYTDLSGAARLATGSQLPQSAYLALYTPYILFGLGRTSNYIEQFFYGIPLNQSTHFNYWTGSTIPNSQVVAIPYKPDNPSGWTLELYITPSGLLFWIMVALVVSLLILAIIVCIFYRKEKKEDEIKKQEQAHLFSFDAL